MASSVKSQIVKYIEASIQAKQALLNDNVLIDEIYKVVTHIILAYKSGFKTILAGNGGSAADAQHIAGEFVSRFYFDRPGLPSLALTTDTSILTAIGNDYGYDNLFARQLQANGVKGDVFIGISTSGNSPNIIEALKTCREKEIVSVGLTGQNKGKMDNLCDYCLKIPSCETPRIQESHILVGHIICGLVESELFSSGD